MKKLTIKPSGYIPTETNFIIDDCQRLIDTFFDLGYLIELKDIYIFWRRYSECNDSRWLDVNTISDAQISTAIEDFFTIN